MYRVYTEEYIQLRRTAKLNAYKIPKLLSLNTLSNLKIYRNIESHKIIEKIIWKIQILFFTIKLDKKIEIKTIVIKIKLFLFPEFSVKHNLDSSNAAKKITIFKNSLTIRSFWKSIIEITKGKIIDAVITLFKRLLCIY